VLNACTDWQVRRHPKNSVKRRAVRMKTGGGRAGRGQQIECTQLQLSGGARAEGSGVVFGAPADPMGFRPSVRDVKAQGVVKGQTSGARGDDRGPGVARVYSPPCPWDTHYQFSIKTLLSNKQTTKTHKGGGAWILGFITTIWGL